MQGNQRRERESESFYDSSAAVSELLTKQETDFHDGIMPQCNMCMHREFTDRAYLNARCKMNFQTISSISVHLIVNRVALLLEHSRHYVSDV